jgi:hypothetical protein
MNENIVEKEFNYDVCLSFADEDRTYVEKVANQLKLEGIRVFYDKYEIVELWGKDLYTHLDDVYKNMAQYCVLFISEHYAKKLWTTHERKSAQERAFKENSEYILPARFDKTKVPGLRETVGYINLKDVTPDKLCKLISKKIGHIHREKYFPPEPDKLIDYFEIKDEQVKKEIHSRAHDFFSSIKRLTPEECNVVYRFFQCGCPCELPENIHINIDLLRRHTGISPKRLEEILSNIRSLGFYTKIKKTNSDDEHIGEDKAFSLEWHAMGVHVEGEARNSTDIAEAMIRLAVDDLCDLCGDDALNRLDFSQLSSSTYKKEEH